MKPDLSIWLGQTARVSVDRPLGSVHPHHPNILYPVNYGEVPGTLSGDGQPIDASLLGWTEALDEAVGTVIAVIVRANDDEDKLVVARPGAAWTDQEIVRAVLFQEQHFQTTLMR